MAYTLKLDTSTGFEPAYDGLQPSASPLDHDVKLGWVMGIEPIIGRSQLPDDTICLHSPLIGTFPRIRTETERVLSALTLPVGLGRHKFGERAGA